jgi:hypothetical protein
MSEQSNCALMGVLTSFPFKTGKTIIFDDNAHKYKGEYYFLLKSLLL